MARRRIASAVECLEQHPNSPEILAVLARLPHIADRDLPLLADAWHNTVPLAEARGKALQPDSPLVLEVLSAFEAVQALFADDMRGGEDFVTVDPQITTVALKAVRDAIAAAYARPVLTRGEHHLLTQAWRTVYPIDQVGAADLGAKAEELTGLLAALPRLATRCHNPLAASQYAHILDISSVMDRHLHDVAKDEAWRAAIITGRRRVWGMVRRSGAEGLGRYCARCRQRGQGDETAAVLSLCLDAACGLLVADAIDDTFIDILTMPVNALVPEPRPAAEA
ncbi:MAG TPA: hypothetical protein VHW92_05655 [Mycobacteriales bacterium]|jgi:hypothetical protein|nr:hypothetical protein [Mycobacteriales bacterium]